MPVLDDAGIESVLRATRRIAIVGASGDPSRPSYGVFRYLQHHGFDCVPVNPNVRDVLGVPAFRTLRRGRRGDRARSTSSTSSGDPSCACRTPGRRSPPGHAACGSSSGSSSWEAARIAHDAGLAVVMDRCTAIEWRRIVGR